MRVVTLTLMPGTLYNVRGDAWHSVRGDADTFRSGTVSDMLFVVFRVYVAF